MPSWIGRNREDIKFVIFSVAGISLIVGGFVTNSPTLVALGAGALGIPGYVSSTFGHKTDKQGKE